jgi:hypothetical protein
VPVNYHEHELLFGQVVAHGPQTGLETLLQRFVVVLVVVLRGQAAVVHFQEPVQEPVVHQRPLIRLFDVEEDLEDLTRSQRVRQRRVLDQS